MSDAIITKYYKDEDGELKAFSIHRDSDPWNPRTDWDGNIGHLHLLWNRYMLGDNKGKNDLDETLEGLAEKYIDADKDWSYVNNNEIMVTLQTKATDNVVILPCFIYEHGGLTISCSDGTYPYNDRFDSGCAGFIYTTREDVEKVCARWEDAREQLIGEIDDYDMYLRGECYGYVDDNGDSCWGFYSKKYGEELFKEIAAEAGHTDTKFYDESEVEVTTRTEVTIRLKEGVV